MDQAFSKKFPCGIEVVTGGGVRNKDGKILLARSPKWSNNWVLPGGHIEPGETILEAAKREAEEETGLQVRPITILRSGELINPPEFHRPIHLIYFHCLLEVIGGKINLQKDELNKYLWIEPQEALVKEDLINGYIETIQRYIEVEKSL